MIWTHFSTFGHIYFSWYITAPCMKGFLRHPLLCLYCLSLTHAARDNAKMARPQQNMAHSTKHGRPWNSSFHSGMHEYPHLSKAPQGQHCRGDPIIHTSKGIKKQHIVLEEAPGEAGLCQVTRESRSCFHDKLKPPLENNPSQGVFKPTAQGSVKSTQSAEQKQQIVGHKGGSPAAGWGGYVPC